MSFLSPLSLVSLLALAWLSAAAGPARAQVVINEFVADNRTGLRDEDGVASDWLELYNPSAGAVSLAGLALTDSPEDPSRWPLPAVMLPPHRFLVIFASGKDRRDPQGALHTNFALAKSGEFLALTSHGKIVGGFIPSFPPQAGDVSYGYESDGAGNLLFMRNPTPGTANHPAPAEPGAVIIKPAGGMFASPFEITLTAPAGGAVIRYTLDGTVPSVASPAYAGPIPVTATTRLKAAAWADGLVSSVSGETWVRLAPDLARYASPLPLMVIENHQGGPVPAKGISNQQVASQAASWLIHERKGPGADWSGPPQLSGDIGIRGRGYLSSTWLKKPYAVECRAADGSPAEASPLALPPNDDWVLYYPDPGDLRDPTMIANTFIFELSRRLGRYAPRFRFVELFLNQDGGDLTMADRQGVYVLMEKISRGPDRLDFSPLTADGRSGGALLGINRPDALPETGFPTANGAMTPWFFRTAGPDRIAQTRPDVLTMAGDDLPGSGSAVLNFEQPGGYRITTLQRTALEEWFRQCEDALYNPGVWQDPAVGWRKWLVEEDWAEGYLLNNFARHSDALLLSVYPWLGDDRKLRLGPIWDVTPGGYTDQGPPDSALYYRSGQWWFPRLFADPDFRQTYLDRWTEWRRTGFSDAAMEEIIDRQAAEITAARAVAQGIASAAEWQSRLTAMKTWVKGRAAWFDTSFVPLPVLNPARGIVPEGTSVTVGCRAPEWWVTTDGSDPRMAGGAVSPKAVAADKVVIAGDVRITARSRNGAEWSGPVTGVFSVGAIPANAGNPVISEIHYHPGAVEPVEQLAGFADRKDFEFIELHNRAALKVSLHDVMLVLDGEQFDPAWEGARADQWTIPAGGRLVLVRNRAAFATRYPHVTAGGVFDGALSNAAQLLTLKKMDGTPVAQVNSGSSEPWPSSADGAGYSLTLREGGIMALPSEWRTSVARHGSPGACDAVSYTGSGDADWKRYSLGTAPSLEWTGPGQGARLVLRVPPAADDSRYTVEESAGLAPWQAAVASGPVESRLSSGEYELSWRFNHGIPLRFLRVRSQRSPDVNSPR